MRIDNIADILNIAPETLASVAGPPYIPPTHDSLSGEAATSIPSWSEEEIQSFPGGSCGCQVQQISKTAMPQHAYSVPQAHRALPQIASIAQRAQSCINLFGNS